MAFVPRTRAAIRDEMLADWSARYLAMTPPQVLLVTPGSDTFIVAEGLALEIELFETQALAQTRSVLPNQADTDSLNRHGSVDGVTRDPTVAATHYVEVIGTALATVTFGASVLLYNGVAYGSFGAESTGAAILSVVLNGSGKATIRATASSTGTSTTLGLGTTLTWSSTPVNAIATASATGTVVQGSDEETDGSYAARIILRRQARPASGNRADWQAWAQEYAGVAEAYVYPLLQPPAVYPGAGTPDVLGCVTVVALGPIAEDAAGVQNGDAAINSRLLTLAAPGGSLASTIGAYIEGTRDAAGNATSNGLQLRPATLMAADYSIEVPSVSGKDVELQCVWTPATAPGWTYNAAYTVASSASGTQFAITGNVAAVIAPGGTPLPILVRVLSGPTVVVRGDYYQVTPASVTFNGGTGNTDIVLSTALPSSSQAVVGEVVLPAPTNWQEIRLAVFAYLDTLGPGDTVPPSRWPTDDQRGRSTLYRSALAGRVVQALDPNGVLLAGVQGVLSATAVLPAADFTAAPKTLFTLGQLLVHV